MRANITLYWQKIKADDPRRPANNTVLVIQVLSAFNIEIQQLKWPFLAGRIQGDDWGDRPPKTYKSNFIHHDFVQFGKQDSRYEAILQSIVLWQQCCEIYFISFAVIKP